MFLHFRVNKKTNNARALEKEFGLKGQNVGVLV